MGGICEASQARLAAAMRACWRRRVREPAQRGAASRTSAHLARSGADPVSDVTPLARLAGLQRLDLRGTEVDDGQVAKLRRALPALEVIA